MRKALLFFAVGISLYITSCSGEKNSTTAGKPKVIYRPDPNNPLKKDSIEFYEMNIIARQKNDKQKMIGKWDVVSMRRQQKAELENLSGIYLEFGTDSAFNGNAGCNKIGGVYTLKGTSVIFSNVLSTKMACDKMEQENAFLELLQNTVSEYTVSDAKLLLRDGSSNIVFECSRLN
ncbi:MAG: META domain-containing protein [Bacteroidota bacterium]|nr:META domain-containing protein [Bacteroidota bacterium]